MSLNFARNISSLCNSTNAMKKHCKAGLLVFFIDHENITMDQLYIIFCQCTPRNNTRIPVENH